MSAEFAPPPIPLATLNAIAALPHIDDIDWLAEYHRLFVARAHEQQAYEERVTELTDRLAAFTSMGHPGAEAAQELLELTGDSVKIEHNLWLFSHAIGPDMEWKAYSSRGGLFGEGKTLADAVESLKAKWAEFRKYADQVVECEPPPPISEGENAEPIGQPEPHEAF